MITNRTELKEYILQDRRMNGCAPNRSLMDVVKEFFYPTQVSVLRYLRKLEYYTNSQTKLDFIGRLYYSYKFRIASRQLGYTIAINTCGPGLSLPHYGTIIISRHARIGKNCRIHTCVNIGASAGSKKAPQIGDNVYIGPSCVLFGDITIANNITIGANATVNKSFEDEHVVLAGTPAEIVKKHYPNWIEFNRVKD